MHVHTQSCPCLKHSLPLCAYNHYIRDHSQWERAIARAERSRLGKQWGNPDWHTNELHQHTNFLAIIKRFLHFSLKPRNIQHRRAAQDAQILQCHLLLRWLYLKISFSFTGWREASSLIQQTKGKTNNGQLFSGDQLPRVNNWQGKQHWQATGTAAN